MTGWKKEYDVIVAGSGAGGLAAAITAAHQGLSVLVVEKAERFGGTTARSGGWIWIPNNSQGKQAGIADSAEKARAYIEAESGNHFDADRTDAFLKYGPEMLDFFQSRTGVTFTIGTYFSDYHPYQPGGLEGGRSLNADPVDMSILGENARRLAPPLPEATFLGMMVGSNRELKHFFEATRSIKSFGYVAALLARYGYEKLRYGQARRLTNGSAMAARMAAAAFAKGVQIRTGTPLRDLVVENGRVTGVVIGTTGGDTETLRARRGVVLATGGYPFNMELRDKYYPHAPRGEGHFSPANPSNTGDALAASQKIGANIAEDLSQPAAWVPISLVPRKDGTLGTFPHFVDRGKPGVIAVLKNGRRFVNEANSYHDYGTALVANRDGNGTAESWLIVDHPTLRHYGLGHVKPAPIPLYPALRSGYLMRGKTLAELARNAGIDPQGLESTVAEFNRNARNGEDPEFGRGTTGYNRYLGDPDHKPNPCVKPIEHGPFYAIRIVVGDLGSFNGHKTDARARVLDTKGDFIPGLYAVGNDAASLFGGNYPAGGITLGPAMTFGYVAAHDLAIASAGN